VGTYAERVANFKSDEYITMTLEEQKSFRVGECDICRWNGADKMISADDGYLAICSECEIQWWEMVKQGDDWNHAKEYVSQYCGDIVDIEEWEARENKDWPTNMGNTVSYEIAKRNIRKATK